MKHIVLSILVVTGLLSPAHADDATMAWQQLARADSAAALDLIEGNHPGASMELGDQAFLERLRIARMHVDERLGKVTNYTSYVALMNGLANDFRDGHIWSNALLSSPSRIWAGLIIARRGGKWVVGAQEAAEGEPAIEGFTLDSCDGKPADELAREKIGGFYAHPEVEAAMAGRAAQFLIDDRNPFITRPQKCRFLDGDDQAVDVQLNWRPIALRQLEPIAGRSYQPGQAGMGVSDFEGGAWIALGSLGNEAVSVVDGVRAKQSALRAAPMVVLDVRGNGGGNSRYAEEIARAVVGDERVDAATAVSSDCTGAFWRASPGNLEALKSFVSELPDDRKSMWMEQLAAMEQAVEEGASFAPSLPECAAKSGAASQEAPGRLPASAAKGRLVLVTDRACFSSCLIAANIFRRIGALHVGEATDMSTRYMEVREIVLPSGLRTFSTLQKVSLGFGDFGPYKPDTVYAGSLAETEKLKSWVAALPKRLRR